VRFGWEIGLAVGTERQLGNQMVCVECGIAATGAALGWRAYLIEDEPAVRPEIAFYCEECAEEAFGLTS
jgi:hypothetical protein